MYVILLTHKMDNTLVYELVNCIDKKVWVNETVITGGFINEKSYDMEYKQESIQNYPSIKDENIDDLTVVAQETKLITDCTDDNVYRNEAVISGGYIKQEPCSIEDEQGRIQNYPSIKDENIDDLTVVVREIELITDCRDDKVCLNETVISGGYIKQEPCSIKDEQRSIHNYLSIKDENIDDLTVVKQETELLTDCIDDKICIDKTIISGGCVKEEPCDTEDQLGSIYNNVDMKVCEECGEEYDLYCLKCPMLIRIFDSNNPDGTDTIRWTLPKNFIDIYETLSFVGIVALKTIPKGVVFGPFKGLDSTKDDTVSKWKLRNKELVHTNDPRWLNWMQYIRRADQSFHQNLVPFQYEGGLYYRSHCHINVGDELLVRWDSESKESEIQDMEDSYWEPRTCEKLDDSYACTFCCVGYNSISYLKAHNSTCIAKRNKKDFCREIIQCDFCKIYLDKKEYTDYHMDRCYKSNGKFNPRYGKNRGRPPRIHNGDRPYSCTLCPYKAMTSAKLKQHIAIHSSDKPFACTLCPYKTTRKSYLKQHVAVHNGDKAFVCSYCPYKATTKWFLKQHIAIHNDDKQFACTLCPYKTTRKSILKDHISAHNGDKPFACTLCPYKTTISSRLKQHVLIHKGDRPFACSLCPYKATKNSNLKQHLAIHNGDKRFACTVCPYKTTRNSKLKQHIAVHKGEKPYACTSCPYKATTKWCLKVHIVSHNSDKPFACTLCPHRAKTSSKLKQHLIVHNGDKRFACTLCPYKATRNSVLKRHIAVHNSDRPFACTLCTYKAMTKVILKRHISVHNDDKPFACTLCPHKAKTSSKLKQHITIHNDDKPFACTLCPYKATRKYLKQHIAVHNEDRPFACTHCPYKATTKWCLKQHIVIHNGDKPFACALCPYKTTKSWNLKRHVASHNE